MRMTAHLPLLLLSLLFALGGFSQTSSEPKLAEAQRVGLRTKIVLDGKTYSVAQFRSMLRDDHPSQEPLARYQSRPVYAVMLLSAGAGLIGYGIYQESSTGASPLPYVAGGSVSIVLGSGIALSRKKQLNKALTAFNNEQRKNHEAGK